MYHQLIPRFSRSPIYQGAPRVAIVSRRLATAPPPLSQAQSGASQTPPPPPGGSNTLIVLSALGAIGGLYYYYTHGQPAVDRETSRGKEDIEKKVWESGDAGKTKLESIAKQGQRDYDKAKATVQDAATTARGRATETRTDLTDRTRQGVNEAQAKFDELKNIAERKFTDVRDRTEKKIEEGKEEVAREAHNVQGKARSWFGWGSSK